MPYKKNLFRVDKFDDMQIEFVSTDGKITGLKYKNPSGVYEMIKVR
jgi:hypothetical protein